MEMHNISSSGKEIYIICLHRMPERMRHIKNRKNLFFFILKNSSVQNYTEFANVCKNDYCLLQVQNVVLRHIKSQMQILKLISK